MSRGRAVALPIGLLLLAAAGLGISVYLTTVHYGGVPLVCSTTGVVDCAAVTTSRYSTVPGTAVPVTVPGMLWFVVSGGLAVVALRAILTGRREPGWVRPAHAVWGGLGVVAILYLIWAETQLHRLCEWCTVVHVLTALSLLAALRRLQTTAVDDEEWAARAPSV